MGKLLTLEGLPELLSAVLAKGDGLVAACCLNVLLSKHETSLGQVLVVGLEGRVNLVNFLVNESQLEVDRSDLGVVVANTGLQNVESSVQILETLGDIAAVVVENGKRGVT